MYGFRSEGARAGGGRSWLDSFIVIMSLLSIVVTNEPTGFVRVLRALRVIRLFGRFHSLRKIISALSLAIVPVVNVFVILFLLISIGAPRAQAGLRAKGLEQACGSGSIQGR